MAIRKRFYTKQQTNPSFQGFPTYVEKSSHAGRRLLLILIIVVVLGGAVLGGLYLLGQSRLKNLHFPVSTPSPTPVATQPTATPSPTPVPQRKNLSITVLNGSGARGAASVMADYLTGLGYTVAKTGNADAFTYTKTTVTVSQNNAQYLPLLKDDLAKQKGAGQIDASVSADLKTGAEVIVSQ